MRVKLLLTYNIRPEYQQEYLQFMVNKFVPALQQMNLVNEGVWHTLYGNYPTRLVIFVAEDLDTAERALASSTWKELEEIMTRFISDYTRRVVPYTHTFQF